MYQFGLHIFYSKLVVIADVHDRHAKSSDDSRGRLIED